MTKDTAQNFMSVFDRFGKNGNFPYLNFKPSILYALAAPSTPESVIDRATHKTFEDYCQERFGFTRRYVNMRAAFADVIENLGTRVPKSPATEKQARPLTALPTPELQAQAISAGVGGYQFPRIRGN